MPRRSYRSHVRGRGRMAKVWVPFERAELQLTASKFNAELEIEGLLADLADIQVPYNFLTAGNTAASQFGSVRAARACTILATSMSAVGKGDYESTMWLALGHSSGIVPTSSVTDLPAVFASNAPTAWPYCSPGRVQALDSSDQGVFVFDTLQKGRRRMEPGDTIYLSMRTGAAASGPTILAQPRILFGVPE